MTAPVRLERDYPGDDKWARFVASAPAGFETFAGSEALENALSGDKELAAVIFALLGDEALDWVRAPKEMLDGLSPSSCASDTNLRRRLRTMLMRM
jgi:hypothetical protein